MDNTWTVAKQYLKLHFKKTIAIDEQTMNLCDKKRFAKSTVPETP